VLNCKFNDGELANIEMTMEPRAYEPIRLEYYSGRLFTMQDIRGKSENYSWFKATFTKNTTASQDAFTAAGGGDRHGGGCVADHQQG
jgi:hypothetical protein